MYETSSMYQQAFMGGGSSLLDGPLGLSLNPATVQAWHRVRQKKIAVSAGYFSGEFSDNRFAGAASASLSEKSVLAAEYLYYIDNDRFPDNPVHRASFAYSSQAFDDGDQGALNYGVNISYYHSSGQFDASDSLPYTSYDKSDDSTWTFRDHGYYKSNAKYINRKYNQISTDIGFFQLDESKGLSFSVVFENILGYTWYNKDPIIGQEQKEEVDENGNPIKTISTVYKYETKEDNDWLPGRYKSLLFGGASIIPLADEKLLLNIPLDVRLWGFSDKHLRHNSRLRNRVEIHTGLELYIGPKISGRFGYAWVDDNMHTDEEGELVLLSPQHRISGGFSFSHNFIMLEMAFRKGSWGAGVQLMF